MPKRSKWGSTCQIPHCGKNENRDHVRMTFFRRGAGVVFLFLCRWHRAMNTRAIREKRDFGPFMYTGRDKSPSRQAA